MPFLHGARRYRPFWTTPEATAGAVAPSPPIRSIVARGSGLPPARGRAVWRRSTPAPVRGPLAIIARGTQVLPARGRVRWAHGPTPAASRPRVIVSRAVPRLPSPGHAAWTRNIGQPPAVVGTPTPTRSIISRGAAHPIERGHVFWRSASLSPPPLTPMPDPFRAVSHRLGPDPFRGRSTVVGPDPLRGKSRRQGPDPFRALSQLRPGPLPLSPDVPIRSTGPGRSFRPFALSGGLPARGRALWTWRKHGAMINWFNITDYGAVSGQDCTTAIQTAVSAAVTAGGGVYFPRGLWYVSSEIFVEGLCFLFGEPGAVVKASVPICPFICGIPRVFSGGQTITSSYINTSGGMHGWDTLGTSWIQAFGSPAQFGAQMTGTSNPTGDYWAQTTQLTLDFVIGPSSAGAWSANQFLFGMGTAASQYNSFPWIVWSGNTDTNHLEFTFRTADLGYSLSVGDRRWTIPLTGLTAPYQIKIKLDLGAGTFAAYDCSSGSPVSIAGCSFTESPWAAIPFANGGMNFIASEQYPMMIGMNGQIGQFSGGAATKMTVYALRYSAGLTSDCNFWSAAPGPANTIAYIPTITGAPSNGRTVHFSTGATQGASGFTAMWFNNAGLTQCDSITFEGLTIENMPGMGSCIVAGSCLKFNVFDCHLYGGAESFYGILQNYPVNIINCTLQGYDTNVHAFQNTIFVDHCDSDGGGRTMFRIMASDAVVTNMFLAAPSAGAQTFYSAFNATGTGGSHYIANISYDNEDFLQGTAAIYVEQQFSAATVLVVDNFKAGENQNSVPTVVLQRWNGTNTSNWQQGRLSIRGMAGSGFSHAVQILGQSGGTVNIDYPATGAFSTTDEQSTW